MNINLFKKDLIMSSFAFWNNKGGTGKTSLAFQVICQFSHDNSDENILVIDVCPQANLSELLLGGLEGAGSDNLLALQGGQIRQSVGGYFQTRLPSPYSPPVINPDDFIVCPNDYNADIPKNISLIAGDPLLELQSNAISTLANNTIPGTNTWIAIVDWLSDFIKSTKKQYSKIFLDLNPSFSMYSQIALASAEYLLIPVMADDSSRRALQNAFSLIHGLKLPSEIYSQHAFGTKMKGANRSLPVVHTIMKNRLTQYMGPASAYATVLKTIDGDIKNLMKSNPEIFKASKVRDVMTDIRDFQTTGVVSHARGTPFYLMKDGYLNIGTRRVRVNSEQIKLARSAVKNVADRLN